MLLLTQCAEPAVASGALNPIVTQATIGKTICVSGWTSTVRPPASYTNKIKASRLPTGSVISDFELDHFIPLSSGGAPRDPANLVIQSWMGPWNAHDKDRLEVAIKNDICAHRLTLTAGQNVWNFWPSYYYKRWGLPTGSTAIPLWAIEKR
jgi:hypothetical protein